MQLKNGTFLARDLAGENKTWRKRIDSSSPPPEVTGVVVVATEAGLPGATMSERDKKSLILMLKRIDDMYQRNDTL